MNPNDEHDEDEAGFALVLSDTFIQFLALSLCILTLVMMAPHAKKSTQALSTMGVICVELSWPERNVDLDLWGHSPGDPNTVGYSNMHGQNLNLLRDVTGFSGNPTHQMLEIQCADKLVPGEWTFNVHYFANHEDDDSHTFKDDPKNKIKAMMIVRVRTSSGVAVADSFMTDVTLTKIKEEETMLDFVINNSGEIDHKSINSRYIPLKSGWKGGHQ